MKENEGQRHPLNAPKRTPRSELGYPGPRIPVPGFWYLRARAFVCLLACFVVFCASLRFAGALALSYACLCAVSGQWRVLVVPVVVCTVAAAHRSAPSTGSCSGGLRYRHVSQVVAVDAQHVGSFLTFRVGTVLSVRHGQDHNVALGGCNSESRGPRQVLPSAPCFGSVSRSQGVVSVH